MAQTFRDQIRQQLTAKKQAKASAERAQQEHTKELNERRHAGIDQSLHFMEPPLQEAVQALNDEGYIATLEPHTVHKDGTDERAGYVLSITSPQRFTVLFDYDRCKRTIASFNQNPQETRIIAITTEQAAQTTVHEALKSLGLL